MTEFQIREVTSADTRDEIYRFRATVWRQNPGIAADAFSDGTWQDQYDDDAQHWAVFDSSNRIIASARLTVHDNLIDIVEPFQYARYHIEPTGRLAAPDRVVVCPTARRQGLAERLLDVQDEAAIRAHAVCALRQASEGMCRLISRRGWQLMGPASIDKRFPGVNFMVAVKEYQESAIRIAVSQR